MSIDIIGRPQGRRLVFVPLAIWSCFWLIPACFSLLWLVPSLSTLYKRRHHMFVLQILSIIKRGKSYYKVGQLFCIKKQGKCYYKVGQLFCITKTGPVVLQRKVSQGGASFITKWRQVLQSRATFITMWVRYYNVQQLLKGGIVQKANVTEMGEGNIFW